MASPPSEYTGAYNTDSPSFTTDASATASNTLFATTLLESQPIVRSHAIKLFLDLVHNPKFNKSDLTLRTPDDVLDYYTRMRQVNASRRSDVAPASRHLPLAVITNIVDQVESERPPHSQITQSLVPYFHRARDIADPVAGTLSNLSLIHRSWTWPAQKAIGRRLVMCMVAGAIYTKEHSPYDLVQRAVMSPLFGPWTHTLYIHEGVFSPMHRVSPSRDQPENTQMMMALLGRLTGVRFVTLPHNIFSTGNLSLSPSPLIESLRKLTSIYDLTLEDSSGENYYTIHRFIDILQITKHLSNLTHLRIGKWGLYGRSQLIGGMERQSISRKVELLVAEKPPILKGIQLVITSDTPLKIVSWLCSAYKDGGNSSAFLERAHICMEVSDRALNAQFMNHALESSTVTEYISSISPATSFAHLTSLTISFTQNGLMPEPAILSILEASDRLQVLTISHGQNIAFISVVRALPSSLVKLTYTLTLSHESFSTFDADFSHEITKPLFRSTHEKLRSIAFFITEEFAVMLTPTPSINPYTLHWDSPEEQVHNIRSVPAQKLLRIREACQCANIQFTYRLGRNGVSVGRQYDMRVPSEQRLTVTEQLFVQPITPMTVQMYY